MIDRLEMFIALAHAKHFGKAAEAYGVTQPTLSAAIKQLEAQLGVMLVRRGSRFVGLTSEGEKVLEWARRIVGDAQTMQAEVHAISANLKGQLRIGVIPTALSRIAELTTAFSVRYPQVSISVLSRTSEEIISAVDDLVLDVGVTYLEEDAVRHLLCMPLYQERYCLVASPELAGVEADEISWAALGNLPLCLLTPDMQNRRIIDRHLEDSGVAVQPALESDSMISLISHVRTGRWASIMPVELITAFGAVSELRTVPIVNPEVRHSVGLIMANRDPQTPMVAALREAASAFEQSAQ